MIDTLESLLNREGCLSTFWKFSLPSGSYSNPRLLLLAFSMSVNRFIMNSQTLFLLSKHPGNVSDLHNHISVFASTYALRLSFLNLFIDNPSLAYLSSLSLVAYAHFRALIYRTFLMYFLKDIPLRNHFQEGA